MPRAGSNKLGFAIDLGNPLLNRTVDGFLKIGAKNALIAGVVSGALISAASNSRTDKIVKDAITGGAIATAVEFISYLT